MKNHDDELEMLLSEIPQATSSPNLPHLFNNAHHHHHHSNHLPDNGYGVHASCLTAQKMNGHGVCEHKYACLSQSDGSSSSLFSGPQFQDFKPHLVSANGFCLKANESTMVDYFNLSRNFSKMCISDERDGALVSPFGVLYRDQSVNGGSNGHRKTVSEYGAFNLSVPRKPMNFESDRPIYSTSGSERLFCHSDFGDSAINPQFYRNTVLDCNSFPTGFSISDISSSLDNPTVGDALFYPSRKGTNMIEARDSFYSPHYNEENLLRYQPRVPSKVPMHVKREDSLIVQGECINYGVKRHARPRGNNAKNFYHEGKIQEKRPQIYGPFIQGYIYYIAKDQHGCRFLQQIFDEGTSLDVQIIFNEIIDHAVELTLNPIGNYLMQKLLEVCNEDQRMEILLKVSEEPGQLVRISLNTHGTRVVQKLIETIKTPQQISVVISALEPGFLALIKDLNGNHVIQRCLQCFISEDSKFIFVAAAKYCVDIATHQHGCCVLQRCISYSTGQHQENLVKEISANGLLLAQDAFGNYVVQFVLELKIPYATSKLISQFEGNFVHLSTQKFSSHVVERCLVVCNEEARSKIIHELLSATYFDQLLQDPHANYVVQKALRVSQGHLHNSLVYAIESHKAISRNSPYSKRIFSHKLLKR